jgi:hypothetical protein
MVKKKGARKMIGQINKTLNSYFNHNIKNENEIKIIPL